MTHARTHITHTIHTKNTIIIYDDGYVCMHTTHTHRTKNNHTHTLHTHITHTHTRTYTHIYSHAILIIINNMTISYMHARTHTHTHTQTEQKQPHTHTQKAAPHTPPRNVSFTTSAGNFIVELYWKHAPQTCKNFYVLAERKYYDGQIFHRIIKVCACACVCVCVRVCVCVCMCM